MSHTDPSPADRIEAALARIDAAAQARLVAATELERRHAALRSRIGEAVTALDALLPAEAR